MPEMVWQSGLQTINKSLLGPNSIILFPSGKSEKKLWSSSHTYRVFSWVHPFLIEQLLCDKFYSKFSEQKDNMELIFW